MAIVFAIFAPSASASTTFGSDLTEAAATSSPSNCTGGFTATCTVLLQNAGTGNANPTASPASGVIVSFGIKAGAAEIVTFRVGRVANGSCGLNCGTASATGPAAIITSAGQYSFPARVPVTAGDLVGYDVTGTGPGTGDFSYASTGCGAPTAAQIYFPALANGGAAQAPAANSSCERLVNATVEADADADGFGDETQDQCPGTAGPQNGCPIPASTPPTSSAPPPTTKCKKHKKRSASTAKKCRKHRK